MQQSSSDAAVDQPRAARNELTDFINQHASRMSNDLQHGGIPASVLPIAQVYDAEKDAYVLPDSMLGAFDESQQVTLMKPLGTLVFDYNTGKLCKESAKKFPHLDYIKEWHVNLHHLYYNQAFRWCRACARGLWQAEGGKQVWKECTQCPGYQTLWDRYMRDEGIQGHVSLSELLDLLERWHSWAEGKPDLTHRQRQVTAKPVISLEVFDQARIGTGVFTSLKHDKNCKKKDCIVLADTPAAHDSNYRFEREVGIVHAFLRHRPPGWQLFEFSDTTPVPFVDIVVAKWLTRVDNQDSSNVFGTSRFDFPMYLPEDGTEPYEYRSMFPAAHLDQNPICLVRAPEYNQPGATAGARRALYAISRRAAAFDDPVFDGVPDD